MKKVMVFGTFDGIHEGHRHFFKEAKEYGDYLIVVVAPDHVTKMLKGKNPKMDVNERVARLEGESEIDEVLIGDEEMGSWDVIKRIRPAVVVVGYDQKEIKRILENSLEELTWHMEIETASSYEPEKYHSSLLES